MRKRHESGGFTAVRQVALSRLVAPGGQRCTLVSTHADGGVLDCPLGIARLSLGREVTLVPEDPEWGPLALHVELLGVMRTRTPAEGRRYLHFRWQAITARGRRSYLIRALADLLGLRAALAGPDELPEDRVAFYHPLTRQVWLRNLDEPVRGPGVQAGVPSTPSPRAPERPVHQRTQPHVLVRTGPTE